LAPFQFLIETRRKAELAERGIFSAPPLFLAMNLTYEWIHLSDNSIRIDRGFGSMVPSPWETDARSTAATSQDVASRVSFEILHGALVLLSCLASIERAEVSAPIRPRVDLARIQTIFTGFELAYHAGQPRN
jgi:hypothetical protein